MRGAWSLAAVAAVGCALAGEAVAQQWWNPARQNAYMRQVCHSATTALDLDECQYVAESLIGNLRDCMGNGSPYASLCASLLPGAQAQLAEVNGNPVLLEHRQDQWEAQRQANIRSMCATRHGGYFVGGYETCVRSYDIDP